MRPHSHYMHSRASCSASAGQGQIRGKGRTQRQKAVLVRVDRSAGRHERTANAPGRSLSLGIPAHMQRVGRPCAGKESGTAAVQLTRFEKALPPWRQGKKKDGRDQKERPRTGLNCRPPDGDCGLTVGRSDQLSYEDFAEGVASTQQICYLTEVSARKAVASTQPV